MNSLLKQEKLLIGAATLQALVGLTALLLGLNSPLESAHAPFFKQMAILACGGFLLCLVAMLQAKLFRATEEENLTPEAESIFDDKQVASRTQETYRQFKKTILPILILLITSTEGGLTLWNSMSALSSEVPSDYNSESFLIPASLFTLMSIPLFLFGKYLSGLAFDENHTWLRPACGNISLLALINFIAAIVCFSIKKEWFEAPLFFFYILAVLQLLLAIEKPMTWLFDLYRPKKRDNIEIPCYESRILSLLSHPGGFLNSLSDMLHYQFGFRVSDNAFKVFFTRLLMPYIIVQTVSLLILTTVIYIRPHENGVVENYLAKKVEVLEPGLHFRLPWPFAEVERINMKQKQTVSLIEERELNSEELEFAPHLLRVQSRTEEQKRLADTEIEIWDDLRFDRNLYLAKRLKNNKTFAALALVQCDISFHVSDALLHRPTKPVFRKLIYNIAQRQLSRALLLNDINAILAKGSSQLSSNLRDNIQRECDQRQLGVNILNIALTRLQPPPQIADEFRKFTNAYEERNQKIFAARNYAARTVSQVAKDADSIIKSAEGATFFERKIKEEQAKERRQRLANYQKFPKLYQTLAMMDSVEYWMRDIRKIVVTQKSEAETIRLDLKKAQQDLLEVE